MSEQRDASMLQVASANLEYGGLSVTGDATRLGKTLDALRAWDPDIILVQEMTARAEPELQTPLWGVPTGERDRLLRDMTSRAETKTLEHMEAIARQLGMTPVLGPLRQWRSVSSIPRSWCGHTRTFRSRIPDHRRPPPARSLPRGLRRS